MIFHISGVKKAAPTWFCSVFYLLRSLPALRIMIDVLLCSGPSPSRPCRAASPEGRGLSGFIDRERVRSVFDMKLGIGGPLPDFISQ